MFNRFVKEAREVAAQAHEIARRLGSSTVEAEHLLLALAERPGPTVQAALAEAGLDPDGIYEALDAENERSLAGVGVSSAAFNLPAVAEAPEQPRWAKTAKLALERSLEAALARGDRRIQPGHILLGVLRAPVGTVPRALQGVGVDRAEVALLVEANLDSS